MKIAYYFPQEYPNQPFCKYAAKEFGIEFVMNDCTNDCDVIYCGTMSQIVPAFRAHEVYEKPIICWVWDVPEFSAQHMEIFKVKATYLKLCDKVVSASRATQDALQRYGVDSVQIYGYVDKPTIDIVANPVKAKRRVIQVSRFVPTKKFENTILAFADDENTEVVCIGPGIVDQRYTRELNMISSGLDNISFKVGLEWTEVISEIKKATVLVSPSVFEGWGMSPVEALFCKVPVVLNDMPVFREVYGDSVKYCDGEDPDSIQKSVSEVLDNPELQKKIVKDCEPIVANFTPQEYIKRWYNIVATV